MLNPFIHPKVGSSIVKPGLKNSMKKLILKMSVSLDGFVAGPKEESDWIFSTASRDSDAWELTTIWNASLHLMVSRTCRTWPRGGRRRKASLRRP